MLLVRKMFATRSACALSGDNCSIPTPRFPALRNYSSSVNLTSCTASSVPISTPFLSPLSKSAAHSAAPAAVVNANNVPTTGTKASARDAAPNLRRPS